MTNLCKLAYHDSETEIAKLVQFHTGLLKSGVSLKNSLDNLENLGMAVDDRVRKDKNKARLVAFVNAQNHFMSLNSEFTEFKTKSQFLKDLVVQDKSEREDVIYDLFLSIDAGQAFTEFSEPDLVYDVLARHLVNHDNNLKALQEKTTKGIQKVTGEHCWHKDLGSDAPIEKVLESGADALLKLDLKGAVFKAMLEDFAKERGVLSH